jgi:hypothetical protein
MRRPSSHGRCARTAPELPTRGEALRHARHERPVPGSAAAGCSGGLQLAIRLAPGLASIPLRPLPDLPPSRSGSSSRRIVHGTVRRSKTCLYQHIFSSIRVNADNSVDPWRTDVGSRPADSPAKGLNSQHESNEMKRVCHRLAIAGHSRLTPGQVPTRGKICRHP